MIGGEIGRQIERKPPQLLRKLRALRDEWQEQHSQYRRLGGKVDWHCR